jgi:hypothetical protein
MDKHVSRKYKPARPLLPEPLRSLQFVTIYLSYLPELLNENFVRWQVRKRKTALTVSALSVPHLRHLHVVTCKDHPVPSVRRRFTYGLLAASSHLPLRQFTRWRLRILL